MRLFVAVLLDERIRSNLNDLQVRLGQACEGVRWVRSDQLHLTVKFLGEVPDRDVVAVSEAVGCGAAASTPFTMEVAGCGCFPPRGQVRIVWAGVSEDSGAMTDCVEAVTSELERLGFPRERRPWSAHVTIGRVKEDRSRGGIRSAVEAGVLDGIEQPVNSVTLMSSVLSPKGPTYTPVSTARIGRIES